MARKYTELIKPEAVHAPLQGREKDMVKGRGGGFVFTVGDMERLRRFLIMGTSGNTYYATAKEMTRENAEVVVRCAKETPLATADLISDISTRGLAFRQDPALFALAMMAETGGRPARAAAFRTVHKVCRTASQFLQFQGYLNDLGGKWNRTRRRMTEHWYLEKDADDLAYQLIKYQNRGGWSHADLIKLGHVVSDRPEISGLFTYLIKDLVIQGAPELCSVYHMIKRHDDVTEVCDLIKKYKLTWEFVPSKWLGSKDVWIELASNMPYTATLRNLARMTANGALSGHYEANMIAKRLMDEHAIKGGRVHPISILLAHTIYARGKGEKGKLEWQPIPLITDTLNDAFYKAFQYVQPTGKRILVGLDVSSSMFGNQAGDTFLNSAEAAAAMAMSIMRTEEGAQVMAFAHDFRKVPWGVDTRMSDIMAAIPGIGFGRTDCSLPLTWALQNRLNYDLILILTDNETNTGVHVPQALDRYHTEINPNTRFMSAAMVANAYSTIDPNNTYMMDAIGFSSDLPSVVSGFAKGEI